jgi:hypothetical protein
MQGYNMVVVERVGIDISTMSLKMVRSVRNVPFEAPVPTF